METGKESKKKKWREAFDKLHVLIEILICILIVIFLYEFHHFELYNEVQAKLNKPIAICNLIALLVLGIIIIVVLKISEYEIIEKHPIYLFNYQNELNKYLNFEDRNITIYYKNNGNVLEDEEVNPTDKTDEEKYIRNYTLWKTHIVSIYENENFKISYNRRINLLHFIKKNLRSEKALKKAYEIVILPLIVLFVTIFFQIKNFSGAEGILALIAITASFEFLILREIKTISQKIDFLKDYMSIVEEMIENYSSE